MFTGEGGTLRSFLYVIASECVTQRTGFCTQKHRGHRPPPCPVPSRNYYNGVDLWLLLQPSPRSSGTCRAGAGGVRLSVSVRERPFCETPFRKGRVMMDEPSTGAVLSEAPPISVLPEELRW